MLQNYHPLYQKLRSLLFLRKGIRPSIGTIAGIELAFSVLKDALALVGMSAYLVLIFDLDGKAVSIALVAFFTLINVIGSKVSGSIQLFLVVFVLTVMVCF